MSEDILREALEMLLDAADVYCERVGGPALGSGDPRVRHLVLAVKYGKTVTKSIKWTKCPQCGEHSPCDIEPLPVELVLGADGRVRTDIIGVGALDRRYGDVELSCGACGYAAHLTDFTAWRRGTCACCDDPGRSACSGECGALLCASCSAQGGGQCPECLLSDLCEVKG